MNLNPGSFESIKRGCKCGMVKNQYGRGIGNYRLGPPVFDINEECTLHGREAVKTRYFSVHYGRAVQFNPKES